MRSRYILRPRCIGSMSKLFYEPFVWNDSTRCDDRIKVRSQLVEADENYNKNRIEMLNNFIIDDEEEDK